MRALVACVGCIDEKGVVAAGVLRLTRWAASKDFYQQIPPAPDALRLVPAAILFLDGSEAQV